MSSHSPPKRPRLSLQIKALSTGPSIRTSRTLAAVVNPSSPTSFNTLSNVYSTAIDRSASTPVPITAEPVTAINMNAKGLPHLPRLQMPSNNGLDRNAHTPYVKTQFPETPLTARPMSPAVAMDIAFPSTMTATPPLSAGPIDPTTAQPQVFCFSPDDIQRHKYLHGGGDLSILVTSEDGHSVDGDPDTAIADCCSESSFTGSDAGVDTPFPSDLHSSPPRSQSATATAPTPLRRITAPSIAMPRRPAPYVHPRALHSILRNSPLPPFTALSPTSTRRQSQRLLEKASRHVMYNSPLTQTITTNLYTKSHIDLLCEEASPFSSPMTTTPTGNDADTVLDLTLAYTGNETRYGGTTPGPFEEMRRRMAGLGTSSASTSTATTPISPGGIRKRKQPRKDKKRRWVWTLGHDEEEEATLSGAMVALKAAQVAEAAATAAAAAATGAVLLTAMPVAASDATLAVPPVVDAEADLKTPLALQTTAFLRGEHIIPDVASASEDVEMRDSGASEAEPSTVSSTGTAATTIAEGVVVPSKTKDARKRKSTPTPYATDSESESGCDGDGDGDGDGFGFDGNHYADSDDGRDNATDIDVDMQTPTTVLGNQLQGAWLRAATATAGRTAVAPAGLTGLQ